MQVSLIYCGLADPTAGASLTLNQCQTPFADCRRVFYTQPVRDSFC